MFITKPVAFIAAAVVVVLLAFLVYMPGLTGPFLFDDFPNIVNNTHLAMTSLSWHQLMAAAFSSHSGPLQRPIAMASFALDRYFWGAGPYSFKLTNVCIHAASAVLMVIFARLLLLSLGERRAPQLSRARLQWVALLAAAAWAVLPINLTAVLYVVQRMVSLASFFMLAAFIFYVWGRRRQYAGRSGWALIWIATPLAALLGAFTKEIAALVPLYLIIIEAVIFQFRSRDGRINRPVVVLFTLGLVIPFLFGLVWTLVHWQGFLTGFNGRDFTLWQRLMTEARVVVLSAKWTLAPSVAALGLYHDDLATSTSLLSPWTTLASMVVILAALGVAWRARRRMPLLTLGLLWFLGGHVLESTILSLELVHEHRNYLPSLGLLLVLCSFLLLPKNPTRTFVVLIRAAAVIFIAVLALVTWTRATQWSNRFSQTYYEAHHHPQSPRATYSFASAETDLTMRGVIKNPDHAIKDLQANLKIADNIMPNVALIMLASKLDKPIKAQWLNGMLDKLAHKKLSSEDVSAIGSLQHCQSKFCTLSPEEMRALYHAVFSNPHLGHGFNYANISTMYTDYLQQQKAPIKDIITVMQNAVAAQPNTGQFRVNLITALLAAKQYHKAEQQIRRLAHTGVAGQFDSVIQHFKTRMARERGQHNNPHYDRP